MVVYNFKKIAPIPDATTFIDIILTRTQRKTPTVIHPGYKITRIRSFYMRKVKFTEQTITEKLGEILQDFPRLDDIHPFYSDLMNILYDRDHFKLALGQINTAKNLISTISKDYLRLMKYGDSLYRCKQLKRAALGRMCTLLKKLKASLGYLEEVRKHISRLPALDPNTRTLLLTGYPNVGKSSFMNKVTRADVEVQPYAFTTKALYVGHADHRCLRFQVVDTPGILDRPLEERNTIEMQAITALAHLQCCVLYFLDISEQCGYPIVQQIKLFESIRPLFVNKQVIVVANKTDVIAYDKLSSQSRSLIEESVKAANAELITMSNVSEDNVSRLKITACDKLLEARVEAKISAGKLKGDVMSRITVVAPKPRDGVAREASIPESVIAARTSAASMMEDGSYASAAGSSSSGKVTEKQLMIANGGAGVYSVDYRKYYLLAEDEWKFDAVPEFMDGKNVMDFFDSDIEARLNALEAEEAKLEAEGVYEPEDTDEDALDEEELKLHRAIKDMQQMAKNEARVHKKKVMHMKNDQITTRDTTLEQVANSRLDSRGVDTTKMLQSLKEAASSRDRKRSRHDSDDDSSDDENDDAVSDVSDNDMALEGVKSMKGKKSSKKQRTKDNMEVEDATTFKSRRRTKITSNGKKERVQSLSSIARAAAVATSVQPRQEKQITKDKKTLQRHLFRFAKRGEADREHYPKLVKHMNSGKSSLGTSTIGR